MDGNSRFDRETRLVIVLAAVAAATLLAEFLHTAVVVMGWPPWN